MFRFLRAFLPAVVLLLAGCYPAYDWRELPAADGVLRVNFPARTQDETREVSVAGLTLPMTMQAARVDRALFAVMHADLPADVVADADRRARTIAAFEDSFARNLQGGVSARREVALRPGTGPTVAIGHAVELEVRGTLAGEASWLLARVYLVERRLIEVIALGPVDGLPENAARDFVQSVRLP